MIIYNFSGKNVKMQTKAGKEWCEEEESRLSLPEEAASHMQGQGRSEIKDFETGIRNSRNTVVMASWVYTGVRNSEMIKLYNSTCSFLYAN